VTIVQTTSDEIVIIRVWVRPSYCLKPIYQEWLAFIDFLIVNGVLDQKVLVDLTISQSFA
jgi:hypothetical protein